MSERQSFRDFALDAFARLEGGPVLPVGIRTVSWPGRTDTLLAVDLDGTYLLLIRAPAGAAPGDRISKGLRLEYAVRFDVVNDDEALETEIFLVIGLEASHRQLLTSFASLGGMLLGALGQPATASQLYRMVAEFAELFSAARVPSRQVLLGLWGELVAARESGRWREFLLAWHQDSTSLYDFGFAGTFVEVKSTESKQRVHQFALEQLASAPDSTLVVSVQVVGDAGGESVMDLLEQSMGVLLSSERSTFTTKALAVLQGDYEGASDLRWSLLPDSIRVAFARDLPVPEVPVGSGISDVHFALNLNSVANAHLRLWGLPVVASFAM